jgi:hypothetical protein
MATVEWEQFDRLIGTLHRLEALDLGTVQPLLDRWEDTITEDNRKGVLAQLDGEGNPMPPPKYRPIDNLGVVKVRKTKARSGDAYGSTKHDFGGFGPFAVGLNNNLSRREYQALDGPYLAPRGEGSRVITNYGTDSGQLSDDTFAAEGGWDEVVSVKGRPFLEAHFDGYGHLTPHDLRGLRPWGVNQAEKDLNTFSRELIDG